MRGENKEGWEEENEENEDMKENDEDDKEEENKQGKEDNNKEIFWTLDWCGRNIENMAGVTSITKKRKWGTKEGSETWTTVTKEHKDDDEDEDEDGTDFRFKINASQ